MREAESLVLLVIVDPVNGDVLLLDGALPAVPAGEELRAGRALGRDLFVARTLRRAKDGGRVIGVYDWSTPDTALPAGSRWLPVGEAARVTGLGDLLVSWVRRLRSEQETGLGPWADMAWLPEALAWVDEVLGPMRRHRLQGFTQLKQWGFGTVVRIPTDSGDVVLKEPSTVLAAEGPISAALDHLVTGRVPHVLGIDRMTSRFVMEAFSADDHPVGPEAFSALAQLQQIAGGAVDDLVGAGVPDRRLEFLLPAVDRLAARRDLLLAACELAPTDVRRPKRPLGLVDLGRLHAVGPTLRTRLAALQDLEIPSSIVHGDFHTGNVAHRDGQYVIFDWSHAAVSHPWMDPPHWLPWENDPSRCVDAYLASWDHVASQETLVATWSATEPLALLFHAVMQADFADHDQAHQATWAAATQALVLRALELLDQ